jgi:hypothetical protein
MACQAQLKKEDKVQTRPETNVSAGLGVTTVGGPAGLVVTRIRIGNGLSQFVADRGNPEAFCIHGCTPTTRLIELPMHHQ